jgi:hypothetical protein
MPAAALPLPDFDKVIAENQVKLSLEGYWG